VATAPAEPPSVTVRLAQPDELPAILALRHQVFCVEQGVPEDLERDGRDREALHVVAVSGRRIVGTCRLLRGNRESWRLGRMAVAREWRGQGVGDAVLERAHVEAARAGAKRMVLAAQVWVRPFYARRGYVAWGDEFEEAGIAHVAMARDLQTSSQSARA
jgi:putative N-acetyltransferase (TIGR04045 family)